MVNWYSRLHRLYQFTIQDLTPPSWPSHSAQDVARRVRDEVGGTLRRPDHAHYPEALARADSQRRERNVKSYRARSVRCREDPHRAPRQDALNLGIAVREAVDEDPVLDASVRHA